VCITEILKGKKKRGIIYPAANSNQHGLSHAKLDRQTDRETDRQADSGIVCFRVLIQIR
jgi:hypothetical protein